MEKYIQYKALDFAENPAFIQWVQSGFQDQDSIWNQLKDHSADLNHEIEEAIAIVSIFKLKEDPPANKAKEDALFNRIEKTIAGQQTVSKPVIKQKKGIVRFLGPIAIAAAMAMLIFFFLPRPNLKTFATNSDQTKVEHILPDQSIIVLAANSTISYVDGGKFNKKRRVKLEGQAFFKVQKGEQFIVDTRHGKVEVLGTTFSVDASSGLYVHCVTGKVKVSNKSSSTINTNGETSILANGKIKKQESEKEKLSWYITKYEFKGEPLKSVLDKLKQEYQVEIQSSTATDSLAYTGFFETGNLDEALRAITWPLGLTFEVNGEKVTIKK